MTLKNLRPYAAALIYGAGFLATALVVNSRTSSDADTLASVRTCVRAEFVANGYQVLSASAVAGGGQRVAGARAGSPTVTVYVGRNQQPEMRLGDLSGRFAISASDDQFLAPQRLTVGISNRCLAGSGVRARNAGPS
jgi:hypothetical protein